MRSLEQLQDEAKRQGGSLWAAMLRNAEAEPFQRSE